MNNKKFCHVHRFNYRGDTCPFCEKERLERLAKRYDQTLSNVDASKDAPQQKQKSKKVEENRPATQTELEALMAHFNQK